MPLSLDLTTGQKTAWLIQSGSMAVFAISRVRLAPGAKAVTNAVTNNETEGARRYLFTVGAGEVLFTMPAGYSHKILAVALQELTVVKFTPAELERNSHKSHILTLANRWNQHLSSVLLEVGIPIASIHAATSDSWEALQSNLLNLHVEFLEGLTLLEQQILNRKRIQLQERERLNNQAVTRALGDLTAVLAPENVESPQEGTALLTAVGAVGRASGITIHPPVQERLTQANDPLEEIARASHIRIRRVFLEDGWWNRDCGPLLGYTEEDDRPVALLPVGSGNYELFDPETLTRVPVTKHNASQLSPSAYIFYRPFPYQVKKALEVLQFAFAGRAKDGMTILWTGIAAAGLGMLTPFAIAILIDIAIPDANRTLVLQIGFALVAASLAMAVFHLVQRWVVLRLQTIAELTIQAALWDRLLKLKLSFFRQYSTGDLKNRVLSINQIRTLLGGVTLSNIFTSFFSLLNLGLLLVYSFPLAIVAVVVALIALIVTHGIRLIALRYFRSLQELDGYLFGTMMEIIGGVAKLRVAGAENRAFAYWSKTYSQQLRLTLKSQFLEDLLVTFNTILPTVSSMILFLLMAFLMDRSQAQGYGLSTGAFLAFNAAFGTFINGTTDLSNRIVKVLEAGVLWERTQPILNAEPEVDWSKGDPGQLEGNLKLDRITFRYQEDSPLVLDNVTLEAKAGEFIAVVGSSGSGKSTILRLLLGFETPTTGTLYYDGQDLTGLDLSAVRRQLGVVLQNGRITSTSIFENIANGALVTLDDAWEAVRLAGFADDIQAMPMGMHTIISDGGSNLSGGQRQRLLIARALVLKPKILLFDEATSALDNRTQEIISQNLDQLQVTRIVIAHRLSTICHADRIYVLEKGQVVQQGTFEQLANQPGLFQKLMARQMA